MRIWSAAERLADCFKNMEGRTLVTEDRRQGVMHYSPSWDSAADRLTNVKLRRILSENKTEELKSYFFSVFTSEKTEQTVQSASSSII